MNRALAAPELEPQAGALRPLLGRASLVGAGLACQQGLAFATGVVVARALGAAEYGMFNLARNLADLAGIVVRLGLDLGLQRHFGERGDTPARAAQAASLARLRRLAGGCAALPALAVLLGAGAALESGVYRFPGFADTLLCLLLVLPFATDLAVLGGAYRGVQRLAPTVVAEYFLLPLLRLAAIGLLLLAGWRLWAAIAGSMLATALASWQLAARARRDFPAPASAPGAWRDARRVVRYSAVLSAAALVTSLTAGADLLLLGHFAGAEATGQYALAKMLLLPLAVCGGVFGQGLGAQVAGHYARGDRPAAAAAIALTVRWIALAGAPLYALFLFWGAQAMSLFGPSFRLDQAVVAALASGQFLLVLLGPAGWSLSMTGRHVAELAILAAGLVVAFGCGALAIPVFGQLGAAATMVAAIAVATAGRLWYARRALGRLPIRADAAAIAAAAVALAALAYGGSAWLPGTAPLRAAVAAGAFLVVYAAVAWHWLLGAPERRQLREALGALLRRRAGAAA